MNLNFFCHIPELTEKDFKEKPKEEAPIVEEVEVVKPAKIKKKKNQRISKAK